MPHHFSYILLLLLLSCGTAFGQSALTLDSIEVYKVSQVIARHTPPHLRVAKRLVKRHYALSNKIIVELNEQGSYLPFRPDNVREIYSDLRNFYAERGVKAAQLRVMWGNSLIEDLIPKAFGGEKERPTWGKQRSKIERPWVALVDPLRKNSNALAGKHIALWSSHGYIYDNKTARWRWQRPQFFGTVEDLLTFSIVVPYLAPMLENSGAYVVMPHERDTSHEEYLVDNDDTEKQSKAFTTQGKGWSQHPSGWRQVTGPLRQGENPFTLGSSVSVATATSPTAQAHWAVTVEQSRLYAVYVAYTSLPESSKDAEYIISHAEGESRYRVNQSMGGGTWVYLGTHPFRAHAKGQGVTLTNHSSDPKGCVVSADAVKIGGGMGNIERSNPAYVKRVGRKRRKIPATPWVGSGLPRYAEGARYWLQWAGIPDSIYNSYKGENDYVDDYKSRAVWVSHLAGGSSVAPQERGLKVPLDLSLALHTDAGVRKGNETMGTLGIYNSQWKGRSYPNGMRREVARELTDIIQSYIVRDIRALHNEQWIRRGMWDRNYSEVSWGSVPATLIELLSHQNTTDMRWALDPLFRMDVARAIYKGILRYLATEYGEPYVVQPLPIRSIGVELYRDHHEALIHWEPTLDPLEPTAAPTHYIVYVAQGDSDYGPGHQVTGTSAIVPLLPNHHYRIKVVAANAGGVSLPSEEVSVGISSLSKKQVAVVNGFSQLGALPEGVGNLSYASPFAPLFYHELAQLSPTGAAQVVGGNTFDYAQRYGKDLLRLGYSYASCSRAYLTRQPDYLKRYHLALVYFGTQNYRSDGLGSLQIATLYPHGLYDRDLSFAIESYLLNGGRVVLTGTNVELSPTEEIREFVQDVLRRSSGVRMITSPLVLEPSNEKRQATLLDVLVQLI